MIWGNAGKVAAQRDKKKLEKLCIKSPREQQLAFHCRGVIDWCESKGSLMFYPMKTMGVGIGSEEVEDK